MSSKTLKWLRRVVFVSETTPSPIRLDVHTLLRAPQGVDEELLEIFLKYNNVLIDRGISTFNIWMKRAHYLYNLNRYEEATNAVQEALLHDPHNSDAHFLLGVCLQLMAAKEAGGRLEDDMTLSVRSLFDTAMAAFEAVLDLNPDDEEAEMALSNLRCLVYTPGSNEMILQQTPAPAGSDEEPDVVPMA